DPEAGAGMAGRLAFFAALDAALQTAATQRQPGVALLLGIDGHAQLEQQLGPHDSEQAIQQLQAWLGQRCATTVFRFSDQTLAMVRADTDLGSLHAWMAQLGDEVARQVFSTAG